MDNWLYIYIYKIVHYIVLYYILYNIHIYYIIYKEISFRIS